MQNSYQLAALIDALEKRAAGEQQQPEEGFSFTNWIKDNPTLAITILGALLGGGMGMASPNPNGGINFGNIILGLLLGGGIGAGAGWIGRNEIANWFNDDKQDPPQGGNQGNTAGAVTGASTQQPPSAPAQAAAAAGAQQSGTTPPAQAAAAPVIVGGAPLLYGTADGMLSFTPPPRKEKHSDGPTPTDEEFRMYGTAAYSLPKYQNYKKYDKPPEYPEWLKNTGGMHLQYNGEGGFTITQDRNQDRDDDDTNPDNYRIDEEGNLVRRDSGPLWSDKPKQKWAPPADPITADPDKFITLRNGQVAFNLNPTLPKPKPMTDRADHRRNLADILTPHPAGYPEESLPDEIVNREVILKNRPDLIAGRNPLNMPGIPAANSKAPIPDPGDAPDYDLAGISVPTSDAEVKAAIPEQEQRNFPGQLNTAPAQEAPLNVESPADQLWTVPPSKSIVPPKSKNKNAERKMNLGGYNLNVT